MGFPVYDFRRDIRNVLVTPQVRARFLRAEPGQVLGRHSHDLGHEVFLVLQGRGVFEIDGDTEELGPGQMCVALANQMHSIRVVSQEPLIMYLSVTPHIQPTHTMWSDEGRRLPHRFVPSAAYDAETDTTTPFPELVDRLVKAVEAVGNAARAASARHGELVGALKGAMASGDLDAASDVRSAMWDALALLFQRTHELASLWNHLAPRAGKTG